MEHLSHTQIHALSQFQALTDGGDDGVAINILQSVDWDVQRAIELVFDSSAAPRSRTTKAIERFEIDDSSQGRPPGPTESRLPARSSMSTIWALWPFLTYPFRLLGALLRLVLGALRIPLPQLRFTGLNFYRPLRPVDVDPRNASDRWVRALEEETGAICIGRLTQSTGVSTSQETGAGPSTLSSRAQRDFADSGEDRKTLPNFTIGSYEDILRVCQKEARIACIILVSEEHDNVREFKRTTLTDPKFVGILTNNNIVIWGGDVREKDAWGAAQKLQATTYPFVAFLSLQPRRTIGINTSRTPNLSPTMTILSRHQGPCSPSSGPTSAATLVDHLERQLLPRISPFLDRTRSAMKERERDRRLREEQDRAFSDAARRDRERIEARMAEERRAAEQARLKQEQARLEEESRKQALAHAHQRKVLREKWRRWNRRHLVPPPLTDKTNALRIAVRLPSGSRLVKEFPKDATLTTLFAFVDSQFIPENVLPGGDPEHAPAGSSGGEAAILHAIAEADCSPESWWGFRLAFSYPRQEIKWAPDANLSSIDGLKGGGQIVVEMIERSNGLYDDSEDESDSENS